MQTKYIKFGMFLMFLLSFSIAFSQEMHDLDLLLGEEEEEIGLHNDLQWLQAKTYVVTASKKKELIQEAPANITVLTSKQIEELGVSNLAEALSFIPGITIIETYFAYTAIVFRGNFQEIYNNKSLLLINGHPSWEMVNGSFNLEMIPIDSIKQIEIVKGPGSVLYGTNAYAGVINVITKTGKGFQGGIISAKAGSFDTQEYRASFGGTTDDFSMFFSGSYQDNDGYEMKIERDEIGQSGTLDYENDISNAFANIMYKNITLNAGYFKQEKQKFGFVPILLTTGINEYEGYYFDLNLDQKIKENLSLQATLRYDNSKKNYFMPAKTGGETYYDLASYKYGAELQLTYNISDDLNIIFGSSWDKYQWDGDWSLRKVVNGALTTFVAYFNEEDPYTTDSAIYTQAKWNIIEKLQVTAGLRYYDNSRAGDDVSPSIGAVYEISDKKYLKVLYGEAFRAPNLFEQIVTMPYIVKGSEDLTAETIKTLDIGLDMMFKDRYNLKTNLFYLDTNDTILREDINLDGTLDYINGEGQKVWGLELELTGQILNNFSFFLNSTIKAGETKENDDDISYLANYTGNAGIGWKPVDKLLITTNVQYVGEREDNDSAFSVDEYTLVNFQAAYTCSEMWKFIITLNNAFDEEYSYPEFIRQNIEDFGNGPERAVYGKVEVNF